MKKAVIILLVAFFALSTVFSTAFISVNDLEAEKVTEEDTDK